MIYISLIYIVRVKYTANINKNITMWYLQQTISNCCYKCTVNHKQQVLNLYITKIYELFIKFYLLNQQNLLSKIGFR